MGGGGAAGTTMIENLEKFLHGMGFWALTWGQVAMLGVASLLIYLAISAGSSRFCSSRSGWGPSWPTCPGAVS